MADVNDVTLSYTFFRSDDYDELDDEEEEGEGDARGVRMHGSGVVPVGVRTHAALAK
jgi:cytochrome c oxidase assembly protein subunit 11